MIASRVLFLAFALLCLTCTHTVVEAQTCGFAGLDFTSLMGKDIQGSDGTTTYAYYLAVCGTLTSQPQCTQVQASAATCQVQVNPKGASYDTGNWSPNPTWSYIDANNPTLGVMYSMVGAQSCWATGSPTDYYSAILFTCAAAQGDLKITVPPLSCNQNYTLPTPLACSGSAPVGPVGPPSPSHGISGGWVFIIILCVVIPVYVAVGCVYKNQKLGATGLEMCPNVEFWRDLPSLIKDGFVFTYTKLRGLCGGAGAKSGDSYETM